MTTALLAGLVAGLGVFFVWSGFRPAPEALSAALARLERGPVVSAPSAQDGEEEDRDIRWGRWLLLRIPPLARTMDRMRTDLRIVGRSPEEQAVRVGAFVLVPLLLGPWFLLVFAVLGAAVPPLVPLGCALGGSLLGLLLPFRSLKQAAAERRQAFCHALSAWCDVVVMSLAAGRGVEQAMETAASAGEGWAFAELRTGLRSGYVQGDTPWVALAGLGAELGVKDLEELGSTIAMAGEEGAAVRETVSAKARTIRERMTAEAEMGAASATEKMSLPSVLLVFGFLVFLVFPAVMLMFEMRS